MGISKIYAEEINISKIPIKNNIIEIKSSNEFEKEVVNCVNSLKEGIFIHYNYVEDDKNEESHMNEEISQEEAEKMAKLTQSLTPSLSPYYINENSENYEKSSKKKRNNSIEI